MHNTDKSIESFARSCHFCTQPEAGLLVRNKDTISKNNDHRFKDIFEDIFEAEYRKQFDDGKIEYFYTLIDETP